MTARVEPALGWRDFCVAAVVFLAAFFLFQRGNGFPAHYHPDEPGKVRQAIDADFNFNHPLLLLQSTRLLLAARGGDDARAAILAGRTVSAFFAASAAALLGLAAARIAGTGAGAATGALVALNQQFYELAHYMKEDPSLAAGLSAVVLGFACFAARPSRSRFVWVCAACGLAAGAKYVGAVSLALPVAGLIVRRGDMRGRVTGSDAWGAAAFLAVFVVVNFPMLGGLGEMTKNVGEEVDFVVRGNKGITRSVPHGVYGAVFRTSTNPAIWALLAFFCADLLVGALRSLPARRRLAAPEWLARWPGSAAGGLASWGLGVFALAYTLMLSFSPKTHHRYFLPVTGILLLLAVLGAFRARGKIARPLAFGLLAMALVWSALVSWEYDRAFSCDARAGLIAFIREKLPPDAVIAQDNRVGLPVRGDSRFAGTGLEIPQAVEGRMFAADLGTLDELRARGFRYVAVSRSIFGRFFLETHRPLNEVKDEFARRHAFYADLMQNGTLLWSSPTGRLEYLQPDLRLYEIPPP